MTTDATRPEGTLGDPLELELRDHYRSIAPTTDPLLAGRIAAVLDAPRPTRRRATMWRLATVAAVVALVAAGLIVPRFLPAIGPEATSPISGPSAPPGTGFDATKALRAAVDAAGEMRSGGLWAVESGDLLTSVDDGATWKAGHVPLPVGAIEVLDASHAWTVSGGSYRNVVGVPYVGTMPPPGSIVVNRTTDGGATWKSVQLSQGDCTTVSLSFVDANRGYLMCRGQTSGSTDAAPATFLRTSDGGATWTVTGQADGLGPVFQASDADTLWTAHEYDSSETNGVAPGVSRDGGATWSTVSLPDADKLPSVSSALAAGPTFWDASNGAFAVDATWAGQPKKPQSWFYRTSDAGRTWTVTKVDRQMPSLGADFMVGDVVGPVWTVIDPAFTAGRTSSDFGASWSSFGSAGVPSNSPWLWLSFSDARHGAGCIYVGEYLPSRVLMLTSDGGQSWQPADFGDARTRASADPASDQAVAQAMAADFETYAFKVPSSAWAMLSAQSQAAYGSEGAFETAEKALAEQSNYRSTTGTASRDPSLLNGGSLGSAVWSDLNSTAILDRAYVVPVTFAEGPVSQRLLVVAPLAGTGQWRVWVVGTGPGS
jgi:hypothetical protein